MKFLYVSITIFIVVDCCTFGGRYTPPRFREEPIVISDVIGDNIDLDERNHYGLFININDFKSAEFHEMLEPRKGFRIVLVTHDKRYISWNNDALTLTMLRDYIEHYDSISVSRTGFEEKWQIVDYDTLGLPITQAVINHMAKMPLIWKIGYVSIGIGCMSCLGCLVGYITCEDPPYLIVPVEARWGMFIGAAIGAVASGIYIKNIVQKKRARAIFTIKQMRKPQEME